MRRLSALVLLVATALAILACAGESEDRATLRKEVRAAAEEILNLRTADEGKVCSEFVTRRLIEEMFLGDRSNCTGSPFTESGDEGGGRFELGRIRVEGRRAEVAVEVEGGVADGAAGSATFARERGRWRLDRLGTGYLRSVFLIGVRGTLQADAGPLAIPEMQACVLKRARRLPEPTLRRFMYRAYRSRRDRAKSYVELVRRCPGPLAIFVSRQIARSVERSGESPAFARCIGREVRFALSADEVAEVAFAENISDARAEAALDRVVPRAVAGCQRFK